MTDWADIPHSEIAVDADVDSLTFTKLSDRDDYLNEMLDGTHTDKVVAQAIETQASGSGSGLALDQTNHLTASGTQAITSGATVDIATGLTTTSTRSVLTSISPTGVGTNCELSWYPTAVVTAGTKTWHISMTRGADGGGSINVDWSIYAVANT